MAKGTRDVSLVIRAKNEASRALDTISSSLDNLKKAQREVEQGSGRTGSMLGTLGTELSKLRQQVGGADVMQRLTDGLDKATSATARLRESSAQARAEQTQLQQQLGKSEASVNRLAGRQQQLTDRLNQQREATARNKQEYQQLSAELQRASSEVGKSQQNTQRQIDAMTRQERALESTRTQYRQLSQQILATENPSNRLLDRFEQIEARLTRQSGALAKTQSAYRQYQQSVQQAEAALPGLQQAAQAAQQAFDQAQAAQQRTAQQLDKVAAASRRAASDLNRTQSGITRNTSAIERHSDALAKAQQEYRETAQTAQQAEAALAKVGTTMRGELLRALRDSKTQLEQYRQEWQQTQQAIQRSVRGGASVANPTPELQQQLELARRQKQAYQETQVAVQQMRSAVREAGTDVNKLAAAQQTYQTALARIAATTKQVTGATEQATAARTRNTAATRQNEAAMAALEQRGRAAMTWGQRLRGEVIALTLAYTGLYGAIEQLRGVTNAFLELEAATTRMNVAFEGNEAISAREMRWVREEADRLGIQFGVLAGEYSKFAIAARGTSLEGAEARRIFESVTVAARVNKLSIDQVRGTFLALTQMLSKGAVSMEELRQQLGERLYGAFNLAADAMGYTTEEFSKLVATGGVASEPFLIKFATQLEKAYGEHLPAALDTFTTDLGRFQNEIFKTQLRVAEAGFIEGLRSALQDLTVFFQSDDGIRFFETLGAAAGALVQILAKIPQYFEEILFVLVAMTGVRVTAWLGVLRQRFVEAIAAARPLPATLTATGAAANTAAGGIARVNTAAAATPPLLTRLQGSLAATTAALTTATGRAAALARGAGVLRGALAMVGGVPGLIITGISLALTAWLTKGRQVNDTTGEHEKQMNRLIDSYSRVREAAGDWSKTLEEGLEGLTLDQSRQNFRNQLEGFKTDAQEAFKAIGGQLKAENLTIGGNIRNTRDPMIQQVIELSEQLKAGTVTAKDYQTALNDMLKDERTTARMRTMIEDSADLTQKLVEQEERVLESAAAVRELGGDISELSPEMQALVPTIEELAEELVKLEESKPADPMKALNEQMEALRGKIPSLAGEIKLMEQLSSIDQILETAKAIKGIDETGEAFQRLLGLAQQAKNELRDAFDADRFSDARRALVNPGGSSRDIAADLIRKREGFRDTAYWDVNAYRTGFGSDTTTDENGVVRAVTEATRTTVVDANRDLERRIDEFQATVVRQLGEDTWGGLNSQQQAVLTSNAYNYGSLTDALVTAVKGGTVEGVQAALREQGGHNGGVNRERREQEAYLFGQAEGANLESNLLFVDESIKKHEQLVEKQNEYNAALGETLTQRFEDTALVAGLTREMAIARAVEDERANAAKVGLELTQAQEQSVANTAALTWDLAAADQDSNASKRQLEQIAQRINTLLQFRKELMEQIVALEAQDNQEGLAAVQEQVAAVDLAIETAEQQHARYQASIKATSDGLKGMGEQMKETAQTAILTSETIGQSFGDHMNRGISGFLDKVRETGDVFGSAQASFLEFAADFTLHLAKMIAQQALLNLLTMAFGGAGTFMGGVIQGVGGGAMAGGFGSGGSQPMAGGYGSGATRTVSSGGGGGIALVGPSAAEPSKIPQQNPFENIRKYHSGGIAGLAPDEVSATLKRGEEVLTEDDPRHRNNGGAGGGSEKGISVVLLQDERDVAGAMASSAGDDVIFQYLKRNKKTVRSLIG